MRGSGEGNEVDCSLWSGGEWWERGSGNGGGVVRRSDGVRGEWCGVVGRRERGSGGEEG